MHLRPFSLLLVCLAAVLCAGCATVEPDCDERITPDLIRLPERG